MSPLPNYHTRSTRATLVLASSRLARLQLIEVPSTDSQAALVLVHALAELVDVVCASAGLRHLRGSRILVLLGELGVLGGGFGGGRGAATEPAADGVAD